MKYLLSRYEKTDPMIDGMIMRRYLALMENFTRGERELTPPAPSSPFKYTPEQIESYNRYELELNPKASKEDDVDKRSNKDEIEASNYSGESLSDLSIVTLSSQDSSLTNIGQTQASANMMLVFSGGIESGGKCTKNIESSDYTPKFPKRRNAVDSLKSLTKKLRKK